MTEMVQNDKDIKKCYNSNHIMQTAWKKIIMLTLLALAGAFGLAQTSNAASITVSPPKFEFEAEKGQIISETIFITNGDASELRLESSVADFTAEGEEGNPRFTEGDNVSAFSLASWLLIAKEPISIPAGAKVEVPFQVRIPATAEAGGHFGTIFFSPIDESGGGVAVKQKVGVLLLVKVKGEIREQGSLDIFNSYNSKVTANEVAAAPAQSFFEKFPINLMVRLTNTGNVHIRPRGTIAVRNSFGQTLTRLGEETVLNPAGAVIGSKLVDYLPVNDRGGNVLPGSSRVFLQTWKGYGSINYAPDSKKEIVWKGLGFGCYTAELELAYAGQNFPKQIIHFWILPWKIISSVIAVLIALYFLIKKWNQISRARLKRQLREELERERN